MGTESFVLKLGATVVTREWCDGGVLISGSITFVFLLFRPIWLSYAFASMPDALNAPNPERPNSTPLLLSPLLFARSDNAHQKPALPPLPASPAVAASTEPGVPRLGMLGALLSLLLVCSCATNHNSSAITPARQLPADVKMNKDAGRGHSIFLTLRLEDGEELLFMLDTGASVTCLDESLEPKLGKRLETGALWHFGVKHAAGLYAAPKLYLGGSLLRMTSPNVFLHDWKQMSLDTGRPILGVLGMDVLEQYCIQLDFAAHRIRFLDGEHVNKKDWGKPFSLTNLGSGCFCVSENLLGEKAPGSLIDTGYMGEGWLTPSLFQQWTNPATLPAGGQVRFPNGVLDGETYPDIHLDCFDQKLLSSGDSHMKLNGLGINFLARHLVTLDFPKRTMYLKRTSLGPLLVNPQDAKADCTSALKLLQSLRKKGHLPGWSKEDKVGTKNAIYHYRSAVSGTFDFLKKGDSSVYHFQVARASENSPWKLQKAWRSDENGCPLGEYPLP